MGTFSLSQSAFLKIAVIAAALSLFAIIADSDFFTYLCSTVALAAVYQLEKKGGKK